MRTDEVGDVFLGDQHRDAEIDAAATSRRCSASRACPRAARHRLLQELLVELDADLADMAGLLLAQEVAGAADVEVVAGELEARAQRVEGLHDLEAACAAASFSAWPGGTVR